MRIIKSLWRPFLALILLLVLIKKGPFDLEQLKFIFSQKYILALGLIVFFLQVFIFTARWSLFVNQVKKTSLWLNLKFYLIGSFFNYFIPGGVGGDIVKSLELSKSQKIPKSSALSTVLSDRVFGLFSMISFTSFFLAYEYYLTKDTFLIKFLAISSILFFAVIIFLFFSPTIFKYITSKFGSNNSEIIIKINTIIKNFNHTFECFQKPMIHFKSIGLSLIAQLLAVYFMYEVVEALGVPQPSFLIFFAFCCFGFLASALPISPAGVGVGQYAVYTMFSHLNPQLGTAAVTAVTALQIFNLFYGLVGGLLFSLSPKMKLEHI